MVNPDGFRYPNAPIVEAVYDIQTEMPSAFDVERLASFVDDSYYRVGETVEVTGQIESGPIGVATRTHRRANGYRYATQDNRQIVLMRDQGLTFSRLAPYDRWSSFSAEARRLWAIYVALNQPAMTTRLALRYINQIVPEQDDLGRIDTLLRTRPEISDDMPIRTSGYFMSIDIPLPDHGATCRITETLASTDTGRIALVLDIDVFAAERLRPDDDHQIDAVFDRLHAAKNMVFEASITDEARRLFS